MNWGMVVVPHPHPACHRAVRIGTVFMQHKDSSVRSSQLSTWICGGGLQPRHPGPVCAGRPRAGAHNRRCRRVGAPRRGVWSAQALPGPKQAPQTSLAGGFTCPQEGPSQHHAHRDPRARSRLRAHRAAASPRPPAHPPRGSLANLAKASCCPENQTWESPAAQGPPSPPSSPRG